MAEKVLEQIMVGIFTNLAGHIDLQIEQFSEPQFSSVAQSCPALCDPMNCSMPGLWHPIPVLLPGKSHGWRSLVGCCLWVL